MGDGAGAGRGRDGAGAGTGRGRPLIPLLVPRDMQDGVLGAYWCRPEAYLDPAVRANCSGLALADPAVVARGVAALEADLSSWRLAAATRRSGRPAGPRPRVPVGGGERELTPNDRAHVGVLCSGRCEWCGSVAGETSAQRLLAWTRHVARYPPFVDLPELVVADAAAWRAWLSGHHTESSGVWLVLAKKGTTQPTTLTYDEALEDAICFGWIDGQLGRRDDTTFRRRFTPRNGRSAWSKRNVALAEKLSAAGRMHRSGDDEVAKAKADGRWATAYAGQAKAPVPKDLVAALKANPEAQAMFKTLTSANRYAILYRIENAKKAETRVKRIDQFVEMLARGETIHPQGKRPPR